MKQNFKISVVTPIYNEEEGITDFYNEVTRYLDNYKFEIIFVDDGSEDKSLVILKKLRKKDSRVKIIQFNKNFGQQAAIVAGLRNISGDSAIILDSDLQDNPKYIPNLIKKWEEGSKIVFAKRVKREDGVIKKATACVFYRILRLINPKTQLDTGDYYLLDKEIVSKLLSNAGKRLFLRGLISNLGFESSEIEVVRGKRTRGSSKYSWKKMIRLALDGLILSICHSDPEKKSGEESHNLTIRKRDPSAPTWPQGWSLRMTKKNKHLYEIKKTYGFEKKKVCIIGGGISGLVLTYYLSNLEYKVTMLEKSFEVGGLLRTVKTLHNQNIEKYYHHIFKTDTDFTDLLEDLGIRDKLKWHKNTTSLFKDKKFYPFTSPLDLLKSPLTFFSSLRVGLATITLKKVSWERYKNITTKELIIKYMGRKAWDELWGPLFEGKFEKYAKTVGAPWFISRLNQRSTELGYMIGSFQTLLDKLESKLLKNGVNILTDQDIDQIDAHVILNDSEGSRIVTDKDEILLPILHRDQNDKKNKFLVNNKTYDIVVSTINPKDFAKISPLLEKENQKYEKVEYVGAICTLIELKKKQTDYYWNNILNTDIPFKGFIEHTNFISPKKYGGNAIVYLSHYTKPDSRHYEMQKEDLGRAYVKDLEKMIPGISKDIIDIRIFKSKKAQPVIPADFEPLENTTSIPNLYTTSMAHIYPEDRGVNNAIKEAKKITGLISNSR